MVVITTDYNENEQSESTSDNDDVFQFPNNEAKEVYVTEAIREWALEEEFFPWKNLTIYCWGYM